MMSINSGSQSQPRHQTPLLYMGGRDALAADNLGVRMRVRVESSKVNLTLGTNPSFR